MLKVRDLLSTTIFLLSILMTTDRNNSIIVKVVHSPGVDRIYRRNCTQIVLKPAFILY